MEDGHSLWLPLSLSVIFTSSHMDTPIQSLQLVQAGICLRMCVFGAHIHILSLSIIQTPLTDAYTHSVACWGSPGVCLLRLPEHCE